MSRSLEETLEPQTVLELRGVSKRFGGITACKDITFTLPRGRIMGLIGPNGAGKTTAFNLITGVYGVTEGAIVLDGVSIAGMRPDRIVRLGVARTFQNIRLFRNLSVLENVVIALDCHETYLLPASFLRLPSVRRREKALRVLLVDDDELLQVTWSQLMGFMGMEATVVGSGELALAQLEAGLAVDVVVLDWNMPGLGGAGTLPRLRDLRPGLPVIIATGATDADALAMPLALAGVQRIAKPFTFEELEAALGRAVPS